MNPDLKAQLKSTLPPPIVRIKQRLSLLLEGTWPLPLARWTLKKTTRNPQTFNEKVIYKMAHDRREIVALWADKVAVRKYVEDRVGSNYLADVYGIYEKAPAQRIDDLPRNFVAKASHGCGASILVWDQSARGRMPLKISRNTWTKFPVAPEDLEWDKLERIANTWMTQNYYWGPGRLPEWGYKNIRPQIIFEELHTQESGELPTDYRFFMFDGECHLIMHDHSRVLDTVRDLFDSEWNHLAAEHRFKRSDGEIPKPAYLSEMLDVARTLSSGVDFVRVDLYGTKNGVKFSELTNYPGAGKGKFTPSEFDAWLGSKWKVAFD